MENPNPNSSKSSSASPKETNSPIKNSKGSTKDTPETALEVLEELKVGKNEEIGHGDSKVVASNSSMEEVIIGVGWDQGLYLKTRKKNIEVKGFDPTKNPICPRCKGEFLTHNAAIEHLRINPNCASTSTSKAPQPDLNKGANEVQPMEIESSNAVVVAAAAPPKLAGRKGCGFDLNELPPPEKDDE